MNSITINGETYRGVHDITVHNGVVIMDGKNVTPDAKEIRIEVTGDIHALDVDCCSEINVKGTVGQVSTVSGDVKCGDVNGSVSSVSGDIRCGQVGGNVKTTSGDISRK